MNTDRNYLNQIEEDLKGLLKIVTLVIQAIVTLNLTIKG